MSITGWLKSQFSLTILYISAGILFLIGAMLTSLIFNTSISSEIDSAE